MFEISPCIDSDRVCILRWTKDNGWVMEVDRMTIVLGEPHKANYFMTLYLQIQYNVRIIDKNGRDTTHLWNADINLGLQGG